MNITTTTSSMSGSVYQPNFLPSIGVDELRPVRLIVVAAVEPRQPDLDAVEVVRILVLADDAVVQPVLHVVERLDAWSAGAHRSSCLLRVARELEDRRVSRPPWPSASDVAVGDAHDVVLAVERIVVAVRLGVRRRSRRPCRGRTSALPALGLAGDVRQRRDRCRRAFASAFASSLLQIGWSTVNVSSLPRSAGRRDRVLRAERRALRPSSRR